MVSITVLLLATLVADNLAAHLGVGYDAVKNTHGNTTVHVLENGQTLQVKGPHDIADKVKTTGTLQQAGKDLSAAGTLQDAWGDYSRASGFLRPSKNGDVLHHESESGVQALGVKAADDATAGLDKARVVTADVVEAQVGKLAAEVSGATA